MNMTKSDYENCSKICDRLFNMLRMHPSDMTTYHGAQKLDVLMDLEFVNDDCPLDFAKLLAFPDGDFLHDMAGIYVHFDRESKTMKDCFLPRSFKREKDSTV